MAFTELSTVTVSPGSYSVLAGSTSAAQNFLLQNLSIGVDTVLPGGYLVFRIYVPTPVDRLAVIRTDGIQFESQIFLSPLPALGALNVEVGLYLPKNLQPRQVRLWVE